LDLQDKSLRLVLTNGLARSISASDDKLSLKSLVGILQKQRAKDCADLLTETLVAVKEKKGERTIRDLTFESKVDVIPIIAPGIDDKQLDDVLKSKGLFALKPLPNLSSTAQSLLAKQDEKGVLQFIKDSLGDDASVSYLTPHVGAAFGLAVFPNKESTKLENVNIWGDLLRRVVQSDNVAQAQLLSACHGAWNSGVKTKDSIVSLWTQLRSSKIVTTEGFLAWKENSKDKIPGKNQALLKLNDWFESLTPKEPEPDLDAEQEEVGDSYLVNPNAAFFK